jgi:uncharacterized protein YbaP (TraB family)
MVGGMTSRCRGNAVSPGVHRWLIAALLLSSVAWASARADEGHHSFWSIKGARNTVYLLGSVHVLKPGSSDLPPEALRAYTRVKALVMEIDLNNAMAEALMNADTSIEMLPEGQTLASVLGPQVYAQFSAHVKKMGLEPDFFSAFQPWFAAIALEQQELAQQGFDPASGVDEQFAQRAAADQKPIIGLESVTQQLGFFAQLSLAQQRRFLLYTLDEAANSASDADAIVSAWRSGDVKALERLLSESYAQYPELFRMLTTDRNRRWLPTLTQLLHEDQDYLVIVGALHLVGRDGMLHLLEQAGYPAVQH